MKKINFNKSWLFSLNDGEKTSVDLPHDFSIIQKDYPTQNQISTADSFRVE